MRTLVIVAQTEPERRKLPGCIGLGSVCGNRASIPKVGLGWRLVEADADAGA